MRTGVRRPYSWPWLGQRNAGRFGQKPDFLWRAWVGYFLGLPAHLLGFEPRQATYDYSTGWARLDYTGRVSGPSPVRNLYLAFLCTFVYFASLFPLLLLYQTAGITSGVTLSCQ